MARFKIQETSFCTPGPEFVRVAGQGFEEKVIRYEFLYQ